MTDCEFERLEGERFTQRDTLERGYVRVDEVT
jgi:hypothetical protein